MEFCFSYKSLEHYNQLPKDELHLVELALKSMQKAYAPYSQFKVGAALRLSSGQTLTGNNQENIAYPSGLCAERVALFYTNANFPDEAIDVMCITAHGDLISEENHLSPCGGCRQVLLESENRQGSPMKIILVNQNNKTIVLNSARDLLPFGFTKK